jgi:6-pyruvoyltetrahydropterin/6-carboxytetrahydropterin synthase
LDRNDYVWDFVSLKRLMRRLVDELDHRVLLPLHSQALRLTEEGDSVEVVYKDRRYLFPRSDVVLLPIPNTTAEMLARYLVGRVKDELRKSGGGKLTALAVEVEESFGQSAWCRERMDE